MLVTAYSVLPFLSYGTTTNINKVIRDNSSNKDRDNGL